MDWYLIIIIKKFSAIGDFITANPSAFATISAGFFATYITYRFQKYNLMLSHEKMERELFKEFNERYDSLNDGLMMLSEEMNIQELKSTKLEVSGKSLYNIVIDYFNLCAEQYYWKKKNRISNEIWLAWNKGMMQYYKIQVVKDLWEMESEKATKKYESYYLKENETFFELFKMPLEKKSRWKKFTK